MRIYITSALICLSLSFAKAQNTAVSTWGQLSVQGTKIVDSGGNPVELQGMSLFWSQWYPAFYNASAVQWIRDDWCANIVRAAMAVESGGYLTNPTQEENKVRAVVQAAIDNGMYVIIDWHDHNAHNHQADAVAFFSRMAQDYGSYPNVIYEIYNEPLNVNWSSTLKPYHNAVISAIRAHDPDNIIVVGTPNWSQDVDDASNDPISGSNIAYTLHYYAGTHGASLRAKGNTAMGNGICLFVTEYGTVNADGNGAVAVASSNAWWDWMDQNDISHCNWSLCDKNEGSAALVPGASSTGGWLTSDLTTSGNLVRNRLNANCPTYGGGTNPPAITSQPQNQSIPQGNNATFTVGATGSSLSFQWRKDGVDIPGATSNTLVITNAQLSDEADYTVYISNPYGNVTSNIATLNILVPGPYWGTPFPIPGRVDAEEYDEGGQGVTYNDDDPGNTGGAFRTDDVDIEANTDEGGGFNVGWTNTGEWLDFTVDVAATGSYDIEFRVGSAQTGNTFNVEFGGVNVTGSVTTPNTGAWDVYTTVTLNNVNLTAGVQTMRINFESGGSNFNYLNVISNLPLDCSGDPGGTAYLDSCNVCVAGNTGLTPCTQDCHGDWGGTAAIDACSVCAGGNTGITPGASCAPPAITTHPTSQAVLQGANLSFSVVATGAPTLTYQWKKNGIDIGGATSATLNINNAQAADQANYTVTVTNAYGSATSNVASLTVTTQTPYGGSPHPIPGTVQAEDYDEGGSTLAYIDATPANQGGEYRTDEVDIETTSDAGGGYNVGWIADTEWLEYTVDVAATGTYNFDFRVASDLGGGELKVQMDGIDIITGVNIGNTGGWQAWSTITENNISLTAGVHVMRVEVITGDFNLNYVEVTATQYDCHGDPHGSASIDNCLLCSGGNTGITPNSTCVQDCHGDWGGTAYYDNCSTCVAGNTGLTPCTQDCNSEWGGTAFMDSCGQCAGGSTGVTPITDPMNCITGAEENGDGGISIYPNPSTNQFTINVESSAIITVTDIKGINVNSYTVEKSLTVGDDWISGVYIVTIETNGDVFKKRIIKL